MSMDSTLSGAPVGDQLAAPTETPHRYVCVCVLVTMLKYKNLGGVASLANFAIVDSGATIGARCC